MGVVGAIGIRQPASSYSRSAHVSGARAPVTLRHSLVSSGTAVTAAVMLTLGTGKVRTGRALGNPVLRTEGRVTMIDGILAAAVLWRGGERRPSCRARAERQEGGS